MQEMLREQFDAVLDSLRREAVRHYGEALVTLGVFGSVGRGTPGPYSDIDVLIIVERLPAGRLSRVEGFAAIDHALTAALTSAARHGCHTTVSPVFKTPTEVAAGSLLFLDMIDDIRLLYDRDDFFSAYLESLARRLAQMGARRVRRGASWHWDLKPDYRRGEIIQL